MEVIQSCSTPPEERITGRAHQRSAVKESLFLIGSVPELPEPPLVVVRISLLGYNGPLLQVYTAVRIPCFRHRAAWERDTWR